MRELLRTVTEPCPVTSALTGKNIAQHDKGPRCQSPRFDRVVHQSPTHQRCAMRRLCGQILKDTRDGGCFPEGHSHVSHYGMAVGHLDRQNDKQKLGLYTPYTHCLSPHPPPSYNYKLIAYLLILPPSYNYKLIAFLLILPPSYNYRSAQKLFENSRLQGVSLMDKLLVGRPFAACMGKQLLWFAHDSHAEPSDSSAGGCKKPLST